MKFWPPKLRDRTCGEVDMDGFDEGDLYSEITPNG